jgi:alpha-beta hydrolase superfamily lysophospholipase
LATYALIPGGGGDPWEWHRLVPELVSRRHDAIAIRLPSEDDTAGWSEYADTVVEAIGDRADVILVAASMGGFTAPIVSTRRPVDLLVLLNAMIPVPGETFNAWGVEHGFRIREARVPRQPRAVDRRGRRRRGHLLSRRAVRAPSRGAGADVAGPVDDAPG